MFKKKLFLYKNIVFSLPKCQSVAKHTLRQEKSPGREKALQHFDDFYQKLFNKDWPSVRLALLSQPKYIAVVNNYSETERIVATLQNLGAIDLKRFFELENEKLNDRRPKRDTKRRRINEIPFENTVPEISEGSTTEHTTNDISNRLYLPSKNLNESALHEFIPATRLKGQEDFVPVSQHFSYYEQTSSNDALLPPDPHDGTTLFPVEEQSLLKFPEHLKVYAFPQGVVELFPRPTRSKTLGVTDYYLMDGASLLPVLALDLQRGDNVLDMCSAPGGKGLLCLQTLLLNTLTMNDGNHSRCNRMKKVMREFLYDLDEKLTSKELTIISSDGRAIDVDNFFNKILVDAPCTTDRLSATERKAWGNNIFHPSRIKERIRLPEIQSQLLTTALKLIKRGGTVVYSTCSLSPIQNDGVVHMALKTVRETTNHKMIVVDMQKALQPTENVFKFAKNIDTKYGHLVRPYLPANFGPTYFCKIVRIE